MSDDIICNMGRSKSDEMSDVPGTYLKAKSNMIGGWLPSLTLALGPRGMA